MVDNCNIHIMSRASSFPDALRRARLDSVRLVSRSQPPRPLPLLHLRQHVRRTSSTSSSSSAPLAPEERRKLLDRIIRVDHAGEIGADFIYQGQLAVLGRGESGELIKHMWEQEIHHRKKFEQLVIDHRARPTFLTPLWQAAGFALGVGTALLGKEAAMACTEAVETVIGDHYNDQLRELKDVDDPEINNLKEVIKKFRDEELEHLDIAVENEAQKAPLHSILSSVIQNGCRGAIWIAERI